jgi:hypothetical protein
MLHQNPLTQIQIGAQPSLPHKQFKVKQMSCNQYVITTKQLQYSKPFEPQDEQICKGLFLNK